MSNATEQLKQEANRLFTDEIYPSWKNAGNVWRTACAMDTLLDYFMICEVDPASYEAAAINALDPTKGGNWWDDFGWIGIAALRSADQNLFPESRTDFLKIAINAWAYMYGPGWSQSSTDVYPFTDAQLRGWSTFAQKHSTNSGAPNVWKDIAQTWHGITDQQKMERQPRYSPGGIWNAPITGDDAPVPVPSYQGTQAYVSPIQNTVTNAVFTILSLRLYEASKNADFGSVFQESTLDTAACLQAWKDQIAWFDLWMLQTAAPDQSLILKSGGGALVRERASTFISLWDSAYDKDWAWTGDQGLLLGALREGGSAGYVESDAFALYRDIVDGVFDNGYQPRTYGGKISGTFLLPWVGIGAADPYNTGVPQNDSPDYQTGTGVFMRYLLQAYQADPSILEQGHKEMIIASANCIIQPGFGTEADPYGDCDPYTSIGESDADEITAYVNRLAELLLAIQVSV
jgi:hypothetical protein